MAIPVNDKLVTVEALKVGLDTKAPAPFVVTITTGQWSGSGSDRYITVAASNMTENAMLYPCFDNASSALLNGPVWCVPATGSFTIHTSAIPSGTVTISVLVVGVLGEAQYQVLADVYSKSQTYSKTETDSAIAQSTATLHRFNINGSSFSVFRVGNTVFCSCVGGTYDCPSPGGYLRLNGASNPLPQLPVGYRPVGNIDIKEVLTNKRLTMANASDSTTGYFMGNEAFSSQALRFNATWVTTDPMPT